MSARAVRHQQNIQRDILRRPMTGDEKRPGVVIRLTPEQAKRLPRAGRPRWRAVLYEFRWHLATGAAVLAALGIDRLLT